MALRRVFTYLGAVFLMSHIILCSNAGAIDLNLPLNNYSLVFRQNIPSYTCTFLNTNSNNDTSACLMYVGTSANGLTSIVTNRNYTNLKQGDIFHFYFTIYTQSGSLRYQELPIRRLMASNNTVLLDFKEIESHEIDYGFDGSLNENGYLIGNIFFKFQYTYEITLLYDGNDGGSTTIGLAGNPPNAANSIFYVPATDAGVYYYFKLSNVSHWRFVGSDENKEVADATNDAVESGQDAGDSSSSDAQTGTASLISTIGSAVSAITSASPTNCLLNGNMGNFDMGQIDLCANPVPAFVQIISSLILILITVPLCIVLFNRFIGLFRSFQG